MTNEEYWERRWALVDKYHTELQRIAAEYQLVCNTSDFLQFSKGDMYIGGDPAEDDLADAGPWGAHERARKEIRDRHLEALRVLREVK